MTEPTDTTIKPSDFGSVFDDWISGATIAQQSVDIYGNPALFGQYQELERKLKIAEAQAADAESSQADAGVAEIHEQMVDLHERWEASKSVWFVRAIRPEDAEELSEMFPDLPVPTPPADNLDDEDREEVLAKYKKAVAKYDARVDGRNYAVLERVVVKIKFGDGRVAEAVLDEEQKVITPAITGEQLAALRKQLGQHQYVKLIGASKLATAQEPVIPAPFLRSNSRPDQT